MNPAENIVLQLLDLQEGVEERLPLLLKQFPEYSEDQIREIALTDPTGDKGSYLTWLLRMHRAGEWTKENADTIRHLLDTYNQIKNTQQFVANGGNKDIGSYKRLSDLQQDVQNAAPPNWDELRAKVGTHALSAHQDMLLLKITNFDAAKKVAIQPGQAPGPGTGFLDIQAHSGTGTPGWPWTAWCTMLDGHYQRYSDAPLYVVKVANVPFVQISFKHGQINDIHDQAATRDKVRRILPLFSDPDLIITEFSNVLERQLKIDPRRLITTCQFLIKNAIRRSTSGYKTTAGKIVQPTASSREEAVEQLRARIPKIYEMFARIARDWDNITDEKDIHVKNSIRAVNEPRKTYIGELGMLIDHMSKIVTQGADVPPVLENLEKFTAQFNQLVNKV